MTAPTIESGLAESGRSRRRGLGLRGFGFRRATLSGEVADDLVLPTLVIHGEHDGLIPVDQGRRLFERLPTGSRFVGLDGVGHNDLMAQPTLWREIADYLASR